MKRRKFFKNIGKGLASSVVVPGLLNLKTGPKYLYPGIRTLEDLKNEEGLVAIRIMMEGKSIQHGARLKGRIRVRRGKLNRIKDYFSLGKDTTDLQKGTFDLTADAGVQHILTCWLEKVDGNSDIIIQLDREKYNFPVSGIVTDQEIIHDDENVKITVSGLPYFEIGSIDAAKLDIPADKENFRFVIMADPQGGDPDETANNSTTRIKIHNAFIEESIEQANNLDPSSLFTLVLGDFTDSQGEEKNFDRMITFYEKLQQPVLLEIGNHETRYRSVFTPGYNMSAFDNYFAAQQGINGLEKLLYSFDVGHWHFVVWPDPLRNNFWETHPHYFDWLEQDLEKNRETSFFFFQHVPMHPIGINPLVSYVNPVHINRLLYRILAKHGNVRYVFSGHVHIPIKASDKTSVSYAGMQMINLPPAGYRPRAFGEEDYYGGPSQGIGIVDVEGNQASVSFLTVTGRKFNYPDRLREYTSGNDPLWFNYKWELEGNTGILNGNFEDGLAHWYQQFVYPEDAGPSNIREVRESPGRTGKSLYLFTKKRGYDAPGQDRLPQTLNQVTQVIQAPSGRKPVLRFRFYIDDEHYFPESWNGAFLWFEGYRERHLVLSHVYVVGRATYSIAGSYGRSVKSGYFDLNDTPGQWHEVVINVGGDFDQSNGETVFSSLGIDKCAVNFGTWTINDGYRQEIAVYIDDVAMEFPFPDHAGVSRLDDKPVSVLDEGKIFTARIHHEAGEHQYASQEELYPF